MIGLTTASAAPSEAVSWAGRFPLHSFGPPTPKRRTLKVSRAFTFLILSILFINFRAQAADNSPAFHPATQTHVRISLITIGPGPAIYERFGHDALIVEGAFKDKDFAFNYG